MVDFILKFRIFFMLEELHPPKTSVFVWGFIPHIPHWGLRPQAPDAFGLNPPTQLVLGYHWLAFLNQVRASPTKKIVQKWPNFQERSAML